jgi:hypothetical protein
MAEAIFYVRNRGKISGPYDTVALQKLVRRGLLSRIQEISQDRTTWNRAGEYEDLFPSAVSVGAAEEPLPDVEDSAPRAPAAAAVSMVDATYYYLRDGTTVGPISLSILQMLARQGVLGGSDLCWAEGAQFGTPAGHLPALATIFANRTGAGPDLDYQAAQMPAVAAPRNRHVLSETNTACQIAGIVVGFVLLLFLNLPVGTTQGQAHWWWDVLKAPHNGTAAVLLFFTLFSGLAAGIVGATVRGLVRAWTFIGIAALSFILFFIASLNESTSGGGVFFSLAVMYLSAALLGISVFRTKVPGAQLGRIFQGVLGGGLLFCILIVAILSVTQIDDFDLHKAIANDTLPSWMVLALTVAVIGVAAALAASILGLCGLRQNYSRGVNGASIGNAAAAILLPLVAIFIVACGIANRLYDAQSGMAIFLSFRLLSIVAAFLALMGAGFFELFIASHVPKAAQPRH